MTQVNREKVRGRKFASVLSLAATFIGLYLLVVFSKGIVEIRQAYRRIATAEAQLKADEKKRIELLDKKNVVATPDYIEEVARNELNMQKEGERVMVLPKTQKLPPAEASALQHLRAGENLPNWWKWWGLVK